MSRQSDFAGKYGYTMKQLQDKIIDLLATNKSPVWSQSQITRKLLDCGTGDVRYRHVLVSLHKLDELGIIEMENWWKENNVTVVWHKQRMTPPLNMEIPF